MDISNKKTLKWEKYLNIPLSGIVMWIDFIKDSIPSMDS
jgi:hypothetical protein